MGIVSLISNKEIIGGLEISNSCLRFISLKKSGEDFILTKNAEEKLDKTDSIYDKSFSSKLSRFAKRHKIKYVIITIPSDKIYSKAYSFPKTMPDEKIEESMSLISELQLPSKKEDIYCDWMKIKEDGANKKILLSYILKNEANPIINAAKQAGLRVVALESRALSLTRAISQNKKEALLIAEEGVNRPCFSVAEDNCLIFSQTSSPLPSISEAEKEIRKIQNYHEWLNIELKK